jgi:hypothetical protein
VQEQIAPSNTGGELEGMLINHSTLDKEHYDPSPSTGFSSIFLCLHKDFISTRVYIKKIAYTLYTYCTFLIVSHFNVFNNIKYKHKF